MRDSQAVVTVLVQSHSDWEHGLYERLDWKGQLLVRRRCPEFLMRRRLPSILEQGYKPQLLEEMSLEETLNVKKCFLQGSSVKARR